MAPRHHRAPSIVLGKGVSKSKLKATQNALPFCQNSAEGQRDAV